MEKELKIEIPQGYEIDRQKSTFDKIVFKKVENRPKICGDKPIEVKIQPPTNAWGYAKSITDNKEIRRIIVGVFKARYNA